MSERGQSARGKGELDLDLDLVDMECRLMTGRPGERGLVGSALKRIQETD